jgi:peptidoglycan/xylan/chitin deacetylase (PgdA/CDA1 family)
MNEPLKNIIAFTGNLLPYSWIYQGEGFPPVMPFYHIVSNTKPDYINSYIIRDVACFEKELDYFLNVFKPVDLEEIIKAPAKNKMHLSFDDGLKECHTTIAPILKRKGIPATFFVSPDFVGNNSLFHRFKRTILETKGISQPNSKRFSILESKQLDTLAENHNIDFTAYKPYMDLEEIIDLYEQGFTIGGHSMNHPEMWLLSESEQAEQIINSMQWVNRHFTQKIRAFSFPFTDDGIKNSLFSKVKQSGEVDVTFGTAGLKFDTAPGHIQRIPIERSKKWSAKKSIHFEFLYFHLRSIVLKNTIKRH